MTLEDWWAAKLETVEPILSGAGVTAAWWSFGLNGSIVQNADDLEQCLAIIATVPRGDDAHRPEFASQIHAYLDKPIPQATPFVIRELVTAVERWEPRLRLDSLTVNPYSPNISGISLKALWSIPNTDAAGQLNITVDVNNGRA